MRDWTVAGGVLLAGDSLLLVQNLRRGGGLDWSTPGGVIEVAEGETILDGLTREVEEETGLLVTEWAGPIYEVVADAPGLGWTLRVEVHLALAYQGELRIDDPDGIVVDAQFVPIAELAPRFAGGQPWVHEPLTTWVAERWPHEGEPRRFGYRIEGADRAAMVVTRLG